MQLQLTNDEKVFLLHLLENRVTHPNKIGWVNPRNTDDVFEHHQMVTLLNKVHNA